MELLWSLKRTSVVVASIMWQPFNARFQNILDKIKLDQKIVKEELQFASMGALRTTMQAAAVEERKKTLAALQNQMVPGEQVHRKFYQPLHM